MSKLPVIRIDEIITNAVQIEKEFVAKALPVSLSGMNGDLMCQYIEFCANRLLAALGCPKHYGAANPFEWMDMMSLRGVGLTFLRNMLGNIQKAELVLTKKTKL